MAFTIDQSEDAGWTWSLTNSEGVVLAISTARYESRRSCIEAIEDFKLASASAPIEPSMVNDSEA